MTGEALAGRVALIAGASGGIGSAISTALSDVGASVVLTAKAEPALDTLAEAVRSNGGEALVVAADLTNPEDIDILAERIRASHGGLDLFVYAAGGNLSPGPIDQVPSVDWTGSLEVNLIAAYRVIRAMLPLFRARGGGRMIMVGSATGHRGLAGHSSYCVAKAGLWMLVRVLAEELRNDGISINELVPGPVFTSATEKLVSGRETPGAFEIAEEWRKRPEDVVPLALFLATVGEPGPTGQSFSLSRRQS